MASSLQVELRDYMSICTGQSFLCLVTRRGSYVPSQGSECLFQAGLRRGPVLTGLPRSGDGKAGACEMVEGCGPEPGLWTCGTVL